MSNVKSKKKDNTVKFFDYTMVGIILLLMAFGLIMLYSASSYTAAMRHGSAAYFVKKQIVYSMLGLLIMFVVSKWDYHFFVKISPALYFVAIILCIVVLFSEQRNHSARWISLGPINVQPSEVAKIVCILINALIISRYTFRNRRAEDRLQTLGKAMVPTVIISAIVASQNLSTALIIMMVSMSMYFIAYPKSKIFIVLIGVIGALGIIFLSLASYRSSRLKVWRHPENYKSGYQTMQGLYAIGSGGTFGKGLGNSLQKKFVPEAQNDMIFTLICEELGLVGAILIIIVFILLLWRMYDIACRAKDKVGSFLVIGVMAHIAIQVILNISVATNSMPNTGVTLPFISYGGSSLWMLMFEMGAVLNVSKTANFDD